MSILAEFETAPSGTEYRIDSNSQWQTASIGTKLYEDYESRNTQSNDYQVKLYADACFDLNSTTDVDIDNITGIVKVKDPAHGWTVVEESGTYSANAVGVGASGSVSISCSGVGPYGPRPWS